MRLSDKKAIADFITILWNSWKTETTSSFVARKKMHWEKPLRGTVKINFNAAVSNTKNDYGVITRDSDGFAIGGSFGFKNKEIASEWVELYAFKESLKIKKHGDDINLMGYCINECFRNMDRLYNLAVKWENHNCNKVVDFLSKYAISNECHLVFGMDFPTVIHKLAPQFELKPVMFQSMGQFSCIPIEDPHLHLQLFMEVSDSFKIVGVTEDALRLKLFLYLLQDRAQAWLNLLQPNSISTWQELVERFLVKYFPPSKDAKLQNEITTF
ncbi:hypothetical protein Gogos_016963, partial [Gossypium gossypioides]|nr:hypothetical protein [Gossypium gossypioides]